MEVLYWIFGIIGLVFGIIIFVLFIMFLVDGIKFFRTMIFKEEQSKASWCTCKCSYCDTRDHCYKKHNGCFIKLDWEKTEEDK